LVRGLYISHDQEWPRHLGDYMFKIQHNEEENELISGTREKSAVADSAEP
jgi:hypothetical protein